MSNENISDSLQQESQNNEQSQSIESEIEILQQKITEQQQQISELNQKLLHSFADFEDFKKRSSDSLQQESQNNVQSQSIESEIEILQQKITEQQQQISELNQKLLRSFADFENFKKRSQEEKEKTHQFAITNFVSDLSSVIENFFMANDNCPQQEIEKNEAIKNYAIAIEMTKKELIKILEKYKVARIFPLKEQFDHNLHEALSQVPTQPNIAKDGEILQVIQAGYKIADRLIKPALVIVAQVTENSLPEEVNNNE